jgi:hypothetical protein
MPATISSLRPQTSRSLSRAQPPSSWSAHPSNPGSSQGVGPVPALSFDALVAIASGLAWSLQPVPGVGDDPRSARSVRLIATALYDVWLITWPMGSSIGPHDHGTARSVLQIVEGELIESVADQPHGSPSQTRILRKGDATRGEPSLVHDLVNGSDDEATSLHVYSPPLSDLTLFPTLSGDEGGRTVPVGVRSPQASSSDHDPLRRQRLSLVDDDT